MTSPSEPLRPIPAPTGLIAAVGAAGWAVVLLVTLVVPALHTGQHWWWPWCAVTGMLVGLAGWGYLRRGRGNAADLQ